MCHLHSGNMQDIYRRDMHHTYNWVGRWEPFSFLPPWALRIDVIVLSSGQTCIPDPTDAFRREFHKPGFDICLRSLCADSSSTRISAIHCGQLQSLRFSAKLPQELRGTMSKSRIAKCPGAKGRFNLFKDLCRFDAATYRTNISICFYILPSGD